MPRMVGPIKGTGKPPRAVRVAHARVAKEGLAVDAVSDGQGRKGGDRWTRETFDGQSYILTEDQARHFRSELSGLFGAIHAPEYGKQEGLSAQANPARYPLLAAAYAYDDARRSVLPRPDYQPGELAATHAQALTLFSDTARLIEDALAAARALKAGRDVRDESPALAEQLDALDTEAQALMAAAREGLAGVKVLADAWTATLEALVETEKTREAMAQVEAARHRVEQAEERAITVQAVSDVTRTHAYGAQAAAEAVIAEQRAARRDLGM